MPDDPCKKHTCPDCSYCQWCSDDRCRLCLNRKCRSGRKLSLAEQIELYDSLNGKASTGDEGGEK